MIKIMLLTNDHSEAPALTIIKRGGKKIVLAIAGEIDCALDALPDIGPDVAVTFAIEEVPLRAAEKLIADGQRAIVLIDGKPVEGIDERVADWLSRHIGSVTIT